MKNNNNKIIDRFIILYIIFIIILLTLFVGLLIHHQEYTELNLRYIDECIYSDSSKDTIKRLENKNLYYDKDTKIVYIYYKRSLSPYLSENGIPCKYNSIYNHITEVVDGSEYD